MKEKDEVEANYHLERIGNELLRQAIWLSLSLSLPCKLLSDTFVKASLCLVLIQSVSMVRVVLSVSKMLAWRVSDD